MAEKTIGHNLPKIYQTGMHSIIENGVVVNGVPDEMVYVSSESELTNFAAKPAGTIAALYGFGSMWQKKPDGTWASM